MKYTINKADGKASIAFTVDSTEWAAAIDAAYEQNKKKFSVPGFRKGKVPKAVILRMYGEGVFYDDAFNKVFNDSYGEVISKEADFEPVEQPEVSFDKLDENGLAFSAAVTVKPEVTLGAYKGLELKHASATVKKAEIEAEIKAARERAARKIPVTDRAAANGDIVNIDYSGAVDGEKFAGGTAEAQDLELGSRSFIPGFEEQVEGMQIGETKDINVQFPAEYHAAELAGKDAVFTVKVNAITAKEIPAADDAFAKDVSKFDTYAEYAADVEERLKKTAAAKAKEADENAMLQAVVEASQVDVPACMVEDQLGNMLREFEYRLMYQGMKLDDYFKYTNTTADDFKKAQRGEAETAVKTRLVMEAIIKAEKIEVTEEELDAKIAEIATMSGKPADEYKKGMSAQHIAYVRSDLVMDKLIKLISDAAVWGAKKPTAKKSADETAAKKPAAKKADGETAAKKPAAKKTAAKKAAAEKAD